MKLPLIGLENDLLPPPLTIRKSTAQGQSPQRNTTDVRQNHAATLGLARLGVLSTASNVSARISLLRNAQATNSQAKAVIHRPLVCWQRSPPCSVFISQEPNPKKPAQKSRPEREKPAQNCPSETPPARINRCRPCRGRPFLTTNIDLNSGVPPTVRKN